MSEQSFMSRMVAKSKDTLTFRSCCRLSTYQFGLLSRDAHAQSHPVRLPEVTCSLSNQKFSKFLQQQISSRCLPDQKKMLYRKLLPAKLPCLPSIQRPKPECEHHFFQSIQTNPQPRPSKRLQIFFNFLRFHIQPQHEHTQRTLDIKFQRLLNTLVTATHRTTPLSNVIHLISSFFRKIFFERAFFPFKRLILIFKLIGFVFLNCVTDFV